MDAADELLAAGRGGDRRAIARMLSAIERGDDLARGVGRAAFPLGGAAHTVGVTGAPGAGKSTLTSAVVGHMRGLDQRVAVLAIDPSSPFTGGALLGDRTRMNDHALDDGVFIRSMATRGHLGGLALATRESIRLLDALGFPSVLVETVGVGQVEVEIAGAADTTVVVVNPGWGDSVQANKAGLMEIADLFVVNKADRDGAEQTAHDIEAMLDLRGSGAGDDWRPSVTMAIGTTGVGAAELWDAIGAHRRYLNESGKLESRRRQRLRDELALVVEHRLRADAADLVATAEGDGTVGKLLDGALDPWSAADRIFDHR